MKKTPLNEIHRKLGARMVDFAGWDMPVQYIGVREEHMAVRTKCGIFDVSHMGEIEILGPRAEAIVQKVTCNDASRLKPGESQYSAFLTERGTFVDDIIVNRLGADRFLICVNASNADKDFAWVKPHATADTKITNRSDDYFLIAVQGPEAERIVRAQLIAPLPQKAFTFTTATVFDIPLIISRTGYTGEDGFEIYGPWDQAAKIWNPLVEAGAVPCGLGARDTLRLEAALPLYGHEIDDTTHPFEAGLGWIVKMGKGDFIGRNALAKIAVGSIGDRPLSKKLVGLEMRESGIARQGCKIYSERVLAGSDSFRPDKRSERSNHEIQMGVSGGERDLPLIGTITSGTLSPFLDRAIALGYVAADFAAPNTKIGIDIHRKTRHAIIVTLPFFKRKKI